jgi:hypothetical protein
MPWQQMFALPVKERERVCMSGTNCFAEFFRAPLHNKQVKGHHKKKRKGMHTRTRACGASHVKHTPCITERLVKFSRMQKGAAKSLETQVVKQLCVPGA